MSKEKSKAVARVTVMLEIPVSGNWGPECTVAQVHKQAIDEARGRLQTLFKGTNIRVVSSQATAVSIEGDER